MKRWGMSIGAQVWLMLLACLVMLGALVGVNTHAELSHERQRVGQELVRYGTGTADLLADTLAPDGDDMQTLTSLAEQIASIGRGTACDQALAAIQSGVDYGHLDVVDTTGRVVCAPDPQSHRGGKDYRSSSDVVVRVKSRTAGSQAGLTDPITGALAVVTTVPLSWNPPASLVYVIPTQQALVPDDLDAEHATTVVDTLTGTVLMRSPEVPGLVGTRLPRELRRSLDGTRPVSAEDLDGTDRLFVELRVADSHYAVLVAEDEATAYASAKEGLRRNAAIAGLLVCVLASLGLVLQRRIAQPAHLLREAIDDVAAGGTRAAPVTGPAELAAVGVAFNDMVEARRRSDGRFRAIVQHASDYVVVVDRTGSVTFAGPAATRVLGVTAGVDSGTLLRLVHADDRGRVVTTVMDWVHGGSGDLSATLRVQDASGTERHLDVVAQDLLDDPAVEGVVLTCRDVTERTRFEEHLAHQARHDPLTGLPNRASVLELLAAQQGRAVTVLFVDLDRFKLINDSHGHAVGDQVLVALAARLQQAVRPDDLVSRFGGDEFVIVAPGIREEEVAAELAERVRDVLGEPLVAGGRELFVSGSVGIAVAGPGDTPEALLRHADSAMYKAKSLGRNCFAVYDEALREQALRLLRTESGLHRALERDQLLLEYQPVLDLASGELIGAEALVRWLHPEHGLVRPDEFIPVAEETGLIVPIGEWVLREACAWAARTGRLRVSVNVSARQLSQPDFLELVQDVLLTSGLPARSLCLELTETLLVQDAETASTTLAALRGMGVHTSIDDFGTGWSSLSYLRRFPVDEIKLDRSYVSAVTQDEAAATIVGSLVGMAHAMGLSVVAEGIETEEQRAFLTATGCDAGQGYLLGRPAAPDVVAALVRA